MILLISILLRLDLVPTYGIPPEFRGGVHIFFYTAMRHRRLSPEIIEIIIGHALAYLSGV